MSRAGRDGRRSDPAHASSSSACGAGAGVEERAGRGGRAAGVDRTIKDANLKHLRRIEGQVRGIAAMVESDRYCADIITQIAAVRESLHSVARNLMRNHLEHCASEAMSGKGAARQEMVDEILELVGKIAR